MVIDLARSVGSANVCFRINERTCVATIIWSGEGRGFFVVYCLESDMSKDTYRVLNPFNRFY